jgi:hypothetical protein
MAIASAVTDLFSSFYELIASLVNTVYTIFSSIIQAFVGFVTGIFSLVGNVLEGAVKAVGGVGKFLAGKLFPGSGSEAVAPTSWGPEMHPTNVFVGNVVLLGIGAAAAFVFIRYTSQGRQIAATPQKKKA